MFNFADYFSFEKFLTPVLIKFVYFIGLIGLALFAVIGFVAQILGGHLFQAILVVIVAVLGLLWWRVMIETTIIFFRMFERLSEIKQELARR